MSWTFNPPPGWPPQPEGWVPPPGWAPDPRWPPAPAGWQFWVPASDSAPPQGVLAEAPWYAAGQAPPAEAPSYATSQAPPYAAGQAGSYPTGSGSYPTAAGSYPPGSGSYPPGSGSYSPGSGSYSPGQAGPFAPAVAGGPAPGEQPPAGSAGRPWFTRWWAIAGLIVLLVIGSAIGFGGTRVAMELSSDDDPTTTDGAGGAGGGPGGDPDAAAQGTPVATETPEPTQSPRPGLPTISPPAISGPAGELCADVALIMITMVTATAEADDFEAYQDSVVEARHTAADELRSLAEDTDSQPDRVALDEFAGEVDASAQMVADDPGDQDTFEDSFDRVSDAYQTFTDDNC